MNSPRSPTDRKWQAIEIVCPDAITPSDYENSPHRGLARIIYEGLWEYDCGPLTVLSLTGTSRQRTLLRAGSAPTAQTPTPPPALRETDAILEMQTLGRLATRHMPTGVGLGLVEVDTTPLGAASARTHRVLTTTRTPPGSFSTSPPALSAVLDAVADQPHALSVVARRGAHSQTTLSVRLVEFSPEAQCETRSDHAAARTAPTPTADLLTEPFEEAGSTARTNTTLAEHHGWRLETQPPAEISAVEYPRFRKTHSTKRTDSHADLAMALARAHDEYQTVFDRSPSDPLAAGYEQLGYHSRFVPGAESLAAFYPLSRQQYSTSVWQSLAGRTTALIEPLTSIRVPPGMTTTETDPTATATRRQSSALDGEYTPFEQIVCRWLLQRGGTIEATDERSNGDFLQARPDGTTRLIYISGPASPDDTTTEGDISRGDIIAAARQSYTESAIDELAVFCPTDTLAKTAFDTLVSPTRAGGPTETVLYGESSVLASADGEAVAVRPTNAAAEQWVVADGETLQCRIDGTVVAGCPYGDPPVGLVEQLPQATVEAGTYTVEFPTDKPSVQFDTKDAFGAAFRPLCRPARPGTVGSLLESATVFYRAGSSGNFVSKRALPAWDRPMAAGRHQAAAEHFLEQYTIPDAESTLSLAIAKAEFDTYLRYQTDEPIDPSLGQYLSSVPDSGVVPGRAWRYTPS